MMPHNADKVVVSKFVLRIPRILFNSDDLHFVQNNHTKTEWVYLREMVQVSQHSEQREATFNTTPGVKQPKHISSMNSKIIELRIQPAMRRTCVNELMSSRHKHNGNS